ncbi:MAG TPA: NUDIX hydrolase, partial [Beijerinckiaceae bacterium]
GLALGELEPVGVFFSSPGVSTERIHLFLAPYRASMRTGDGGGLAGEGERIETCETPVAALRAAGGTVELRDLKTAYLVERLRLLRPQLFAPEP